MKILWTVNTLPPRVAKELGVESGHPISWVDAMSEELVKLPSIELSIATPSSISCVIHKRINKINFFAVPNNKNEWKKIILECKPDLIHMYGTELKHNLYVKEVAKEIPCLVSLQGILSEYQRHYYAGIDFSTIIRNTSLIDLFRPCGILSGRNDFIKRAVNEKKLLKSVKYVEGRTTWDKVSSLNINSELVYYECPRMLRKCFYNSDPWRVTSFKRHTIFVSQGNYPIKGLHFMLEALAKLKINYPDVKLLIAGNNIFERCGVRKYLIPGYVKYLKKLVSLYNISDNIVFLGNKTAKEMAELFSHVHVAVVSSSIENAPNSLAEAMMMGTPCVASFVGGNMDMITHKEDGYLYCYNEPNMLAEYITKIFRDDKLAAFFSQNARNKAMLKHNPSKLVNQLLYIYSDILRKEIK